MATRRSHEYISGRDSIVEKAAIRNTAGDNGLRRFKPDQEKIAALYSLVTDPLQRQAVALKTGIFYGEIKSIDEVARIMKISREQAETLIKHAANLLNPPPKKG